MPVVTVFLSQFYISYLYSLSSSNKMVESVLYFLFYLLSSSYSMVESILYFLTLFTVQLGLL